MAVNDKKSVTADVKVKRSTGSDTSTGIESRKFVSATGKGAISSTLKNYATAPLFLKKAAEAKAELDRVGLPKIAK